MTSHLDEAVQKSFTIVEYEAKYAKSLADMWNLSSDSWGGDHVLQTEEGIMEEMENSPNLKTFLAVQQDEVIGFCSFSYYQEDRGALYIPLLNVRPDFHGRKVGKALVLNAVQQTIDMGWPRLDLYTWAGNTKAVPTYKKCGFFWERRDETTHLMNFIPAVLQTEALLPFFEQADWYEDGKRDLSVTPDGSGENGFDYFTYEWERDGRYLSVEFERTGRGIRFIETDTYRIAAEISKHRLPFGKRYEISYDIISKDGQPLTVEIEGVSNESIDFNIHEHIETTGTSQVQAFFKVNEISEEPNKWRTHPVVEARLTINGRRADFRTGVYPAFPVTLKLNSELSDFVTGQTAAFELNVENHYDEETRFVFTLPEGGLLEWKQPEQDMILPPQGRAVIPIEAKVLATGLYAEQVRIQAYSGGEVMDLTCEVSKLVQGHTGLFDGETLDEWIIGSGAYTAHLHKHNLTLTLKTIGMRYGRTTLYFPKFGPPFRNEFMDQRPFQIEHEYDAESVTLKASYRMKQLQDRTLVLTAKLYSSGLLERYFLISKPQDGDASGELSMRELFHTSMECGVIPYNQVLHETNIRMNGYQRPVGSEDKTVIFLCEHNGSAKMVRIGLFLH